MKNISLSIIGVGLVMTALTACSDKTDAIMIAGRPQAAAFDTIINQKKVTLYTIKNNKGMEVDVTNFGGRVVSIIVPDKEGKPTDVVLGFDNVAQYADSVNSPSDFGAAIGRYANRINKGRITIDGHTIQLPTNNFGHCLHGGFAGWQYQVYEARQENDSTLLLTMKSADGDSNFPGNVTATVTYTVKADNSLDISYRGTTDKKTVLNMTNHSYFNLNGDANTKVDNCLLMINADNYTPSDTTYMTTGEVAPVENTPMDFRTPTAIGKDVENFDFAQVKNANGFDHNWCLNTYVGGKGDDTQVAASLYSPVTGIKLEVFTNEPGIQVYTGNFLNGTLKGKYGITYGQRTGCCLETQKYPDSPNKPQWASPFLAPGEEFYSHCIYKFSIE